MLRRIKASAGSGKTHELTERFLDLLVRARPAPYAPSCAAGTEHAWGDILAVTFTNRAASEMKERVLRRLKEAALGKIRLPAPWTPALAAGWVDRLVRQYGSLNIRTIDSLLHRVVSAAALTLGLLPDFKTVYTGVEASAPQLDALLERAGQGDEETARLVRACCESIFFHTRHKGWLAGKRLREELVALLEYFLEHEPAERQGAEHIETARSVLIENYAEAARHMERLLEKEDLAPHKNFARLLETAPALPARQFPVLLTKEDLDECLLKASRIKASPEAKEAYALLCACAERLDSEGEILRLALEKLPFIRLAAHLLEDFIEAQRREGALPAIRIPALARRSMEEEGVSALLCRISSGIAHILIDEFQDTSRTQWEALRPLALEALARGGSLTWVGDVKQAVYGWRGGDAALFEELSEDRELTNICPQPLFDSLPANWRSRAEIVTFNNKLFSLPAKAEHALAALARLLPHDCPPDIMGEAAAALHGAFAGAGQTLPDRPASRGGFVHLRPVTGERAEDLDEAVFENLQEVLRDIGARRPWGEIAVLVRSNAKASAVAARLLELGIPVLTENSLLLAAHPLVRQCVAFLRLLHDPRDETALWEFCLSPIFTGLYGLDAQSLSDWAAGRPQGLLHKQFQERFPDIWARFFAPFFRSGPLTAYDLLQEFLARFRVRERFPESAAFTRRLSEVVYAAEEQGRASPAEFLEAWDKGGAEEKLPMPEGMDAVRIMTIHKAKGLEFPVVILPWTHFGLRPDRDYAKYELPACGDREALNLFAPLCREMGAPYFKALADDAREALHVLYVACTRASEELYIFRTDTDRTAQAENTMSAVLACWLAELGINPNAPYSGGAPLSSRPVPKAASVAPPQPVAFDIPDETLPPMHWLPKLRIRRTAFPETPESPRLRGILAHRCLEFLTPSGSPEEDAKRAARLGCRSLRVRPTEEQHADLVRSLAWYAALPEAGLWAKLGSPEHSLLDEQGRLHRVDMLVEEEERRTVLEYKSGREEEEHITQLRRYLSLLERVGGGRARGLLIYLASRKCLEVNARGVRQVFWEPEARP